VKLRYILHDNNSAYNVSLGDVMAIVRYLERVLYKRADHKLLFALKSLYSITLYDNYVDYRDNYTDNIVKSKRDENDNTPKKHEICRSGFMPYASNLEKMVGGNFVNSDHDIAAMLPPDREGNTREQRVISIAAIKDIEKPLVVREFFALTTSRRIDRSDRGVNFEYRQLPQAYYAQDFKSVGFGVFDVMSIFFNL